MVTICNLATPLSFGYLVLFGGWVGGIIYTFIKLSAIVDIIGAIFGWIILPRLLKVVILFTPVRFFVSMMDVFIKIGYIGFAFSVILTTLCKVLKILD